MVRLNSRCEFIYYNTSYYLQSRFSKKKKSTITDEDFQLQSKVNWCEKIKIKKGRRRTEATIRGRERVKD